LVTLTGMFKRWYSAEFMVSFGNSKWLIGAISFLID